MSLTEFLLARIAEDEAVARDAIDPDRPGTHWRWHWNDNDQAIVTERDDEFKASLRTVEEFPTNYVGDLPAFPLGYVEVEEYYALPHIARHDPARVLAECEAKRRIVELHAEHAGHCETCHDGEYYTDWQGPADYPCGTVLALAKPYIDHPDFDWRLL